MQNINEINQPRNGYVRTISNDLKGGFARHVWVKKIPIEMDIEEVSLICTVLPTEANGDIIYTRSIRPYQRNMKASNEVLVEESTGILVVPQMVGGEQVFINVLTGEPGTGPFIGQYDFFVPFLSNPVSLPTFVDLAISQGDQAKTFDLFDPLNTQT